MSMLSPRGRALVVASLALAALPVTAHALPGDPPILPLTPADGASVPPHADGIPVTYRCPAYTQEIYGDTSDPIIDRGSSEDYRVGFSDRPALGANGLLATTPYGSANAHSLGGDTCATTFDTYDSSSSPEIVGGRVYWQARRSCIGCPGQRADTGPVRSFVVRPPTVRGTLRVPRLYGGYLAVFTVQSRTKYGRQVLLQRRVGRKWRTFDSRPFNTRTELIASLPAGRQRIRAVVLIGPSRVTVATRTVSVRRGGRRVTSGRDDGRYAARRAPRNSTLDFAVTGGGRMLQAFKASVTAFCFGPTLGDNRLITTFAVLRPVPIAPDGSVVGLLETKRGARETLVGHLRGRRFRGEVSVSLSTCNGSRKLDAVRRR
jgi:hypothetical protein